MIRRAIERIVLRAQRSGAKAWLFKHVVRHTMNRNVTKIRSTQPSRDDKRNESLVLVERSTREPPLPPSALINPPDIGTYVGNRVKGFLHMGVIEHQAWASWALRSRSIWNRSTRWCWSRWAAWSRWERRTGSKVWLVEKWAQQRAREGRQRTPRPLQPRVHHDRLPARPPRDAGRSRCDVQRRGVRGVRTRTDVSRSTGLQRRPSREVERQMTRRGEKGERTTRMPPDARLSVRRSVRSRPISGSPENDETLETVEFPAFL